MVKSRPTPAFPAPALLQRLPVLLGLLVVLLVPFFLPIPVALRRHPFISHLGDQVHVPFLMALTLLIYWRGPLTGRLKAAVVAAMVLGGSIEFLQILVGRAALLHDFWLDLAGIGMAAGLVIWKGHHLRLGLGLIVAMVMILMAQVYYLPALVLGSYRCHRSFPLISDLEGPHEKWLWKIADESHVEFSTIPGGPESNQTVLRLEGGPPSRWPGVQMRHFPHDWTDFTMLKLDVRHVTTGRETIPFSVRLDDFQSRRDKTWISDRFSATKEWATYSIPITDRQVRQGDRSFNFQDVSILLVFLSDKNDSTAIEIDNLRLE